MVRSGFSRWRFTARRLLFSGFGVSQQNALRVAFLSVFLAGLSGAVPASSSAQSDPPQSAPLPGQRTLQCWWTGDYGGPDNAPAAVTMVDAGNGDIEPNGNWYCVGPGKSLIRRVYSDLARSRCLQVSLPLASRACSPGHYLANALSTAGGRVPKARLPQRSRWWTSVAVISNRMATGIALDRGTRLTRRVNSAGKCAWCLQGNLQAAQQASMSTGFG